MSDEWEQEQGIEFDDERPARRRPVEPVAPDDGRTQNLRAALERLGYQRTEHDSVSNPIEAGTDLAKHITSTSGVVGLLAVVLTGGMFALVWQLMGGQQDALGTVATHQTAMARRLDSLKDELEDVQKEIANLRFALGSQGQPRSPYNVRDYRGQGNESDRNR